MSSMSRVESVGRERPVDPDLPVAVDVAVIMYTTGSTGFPKVNTDYLVGFYIRR